ncbi:MAG: hypoxanthine phosphoribosyltransferase [Bacteroidales bacterium]|jgi:hypoxanthine phosphoribosyltransferase|nr:hypoxanthine phosphoribosyltransferase [Bacteroidales bacterium]
MEEYKIKDRVFCKYIPSDELETITNKISKQINIDYKDKEIMFIVVLNGAFMFASDLFKKIEGKAKISFVKLSSYSGNQTTGKVRELIGLNEDIKDKDVIIVEDIIDTGITMENLLKKLSSYKPKTLEIATLMFKPHRFMKDYPIKYIGKDIEDEFIIGYGFDYDGYGRNLKDIYQEKK